MKTLRSLFFGALTITALLLALPAISAPVIIAGSPATVNNTTSNFLATAAFAYNPTLQQFSVTHGGLANTNDIKLNIQATLDSANYVTVGSWSPAFTNAGTEIIYQGVYSVTNLVRCQVVTTNSQTIYISYGK